MQRHNLESMPGSPIYDEDNRGISYREGGACSRLLRRGRGRISGRGLMLLPRTTRRREKYCTIVTIMLVTLHANESDVHKKVPYCWL